MARLRNINAGISIISGTMWLHDPPTSTFEMANITICAIYFSRLRKFSWMRGVAMSCNSRRPRGNSDQIRIFPVNLENPRVCLMKFSKRAKHAAGKSNYVDFGENYLQMSCLCPAAGAAGQVEKVSGDDEISTRLEPVQKSRLFYRSISQAYFRIIKFSTKQTSV